MGCFQCQQIYALDRSYKFCFRYFDLCTDVFHHLSGAVVGGHLFHELSDPAQQALYIAVFQAGWFVESMWTQTLVIHMIRTPKIPFLQSRASAPVTLLTFIGIAVLTVIPFTAVGHAIGLASLPGEYFSWLAAITLAYMLLATMMKKLYIKRYGELL